jgi:hypothetical protein
LKPALCSTGKPRNGKSVDGVRLDFPPWMMKPALIRRWTWRASMVFWRQMAYVDPRIRMSSMQKTVLIPLISNFA